MRTPALIIAVALGACSAPADLAVDVFPVVVKGVPIAAVAPPEAPRFESCPAGWRSEGTAPATCAPWPAGGMKSCGSDQAHFAGDADCARIGTACPAGDWPDTFPSARPVLYVRAGAPAGGNGSRQAPYATLGEAWRSGRAASHLVALSKGTHVTSDVLPAGAVVWGACVAQTTLTSPPGAMMGAVVYSLDPGNEVHNLRVTGSVVGVAVWGGTGAELLLEDVLVERARAIGIWVRDAGRATLRGVAVRDIVEVNGLGDGLYVTHGATVTGSRLAFTGVPAHGVQVFGMGARVTLTDVAVSQAPNTSGNGLGVGGISLLDGAGGELERVVVESARSHGVEATSCSATVLKDAVIRGTQRVDAAETHGIGLRVGNCQVDAQRLVITGSAGVGVLADGASVTLDDVVLTDNAVGSRFPFGAGVYTLNAPTVRLRRAWLDGNAGMTVKAGGGTFEGADLTVANTRPDREGNWGFGIYASRAATTLQRVHLDRARFGALDVSGGTLQASDVRITGTQLDTGFGTFGTGLYLGAGARGSITRLEVSGSRTIGVSAEQAGTDLEASDVIVRDTAHECGPAAAPDCATYGSTGVFAAYGAHVRLTRFLVENNGNQGLLLAEGGEADLAGGIVAGHGIGATVMTNPFDLARLDTDVTYVGNGRKVDATVVPLPRSPPGPPDRP